MKKRVVITGSTRGIGFGLAAEFLGRNCAVTISGRSRSGVDEAVDKLARTHERASILGQPCDVTDYDQVAALWDAAVARFGAVDVWINNAGIGHDSVPLWQLDAATVAAVVATNVNGSLYGAQIAIKGMMAQGYGQIYNMEGFGSQGRTRPGMSVYGTTKAAIHYLTTALIEETEGTAVLVGSISPGMVITDLVLEPMRKDPEMLARSKRILNIIADRVETVTPYIVEQVLANDSHGARIRWLTRPRLFWRFLTAPFSKRDVFGE